MPSASATSTADDVGERAADRALGRAEPPHHVGLGARSERAQPALHQRGVAGPLVQRGDLLPQPLRGEGPVRARGLPAPVVAAPEHDPVGGERREHARGDGELAAVALARRHLQAYVEHRDPFAQHRRGRGRRTQLGQHRGAHLPEPGRPVRSEPGGLDLLGEPGAELCGHPGGGRAPHRGQQVAREREDGAPHRELADDGAVVEQRPLDVVPRRPRPARAPRGRRWPARSRAGRSSPRRPPRPWPPSPTAPARAGPPAAPGARRR